MPIVTDVAFISPRALATQYGAQLLARSELTRWYQGDANAVVQSSGITQLTDKKASGTNFTVYDASKKAALAAGVLNNYSVVDFAANLSQYTASGTAFPFGSAYSMAFIIKMGAAGEHIFAKWGSPGNVDITSFQSGSRYLQFTHGTGSIATIVPTTGFHLLVVSFDGTATLRYRLDGASQNPVATTNNIAALSTSVYIGTPFSLVPPSSNLFTGQMSDALFFMGTDINLPANAHVLSLLEQWAVGTYGLGFSPLIA